MEDWKNISNETSWVLTATNIMTQITRLIGKELNNTVLKCILVKPTLPGFFGPRFSGVKNDSPFLLPWEMSQYLKLMERYWKMMLSQNLTSMTNHVIRNKFFWSSPYIEETCKGSTSKYIKSKKVCIKSKKCWISQIFIRISS